MQGKSKYSNNSNDTTGSQVKNCVYTQKGHRQVIAAFRLQDKNNEYGG